MSPGSTANQLAAAILAPNTAGFLVSSSLSGSDVQAEVFTTALLDFPVCGNSYAVLSTGIAANAPGAPVDFESVNVGGPFIGGGSPEGYDAFDVVTLTLHLSLPSNARSLKFYFKFATEENPTYLNSVFQDFFTATVKDQFGAVIAQIARLPDGNIVTVDKAAVFSNAVGGTSMSPEQPFPTPSNTVYNAVTYEFLVASCDVAAYAGSTISIVFQLGDASDSILDSAVFIDQLQVSTLPKFYPVITSPLEITPLRLFYQVGDSLTAQFTITNKGTDPITFDVLVVGGRGPTGEIVDFSKAYNITLNPGYSYNYQGFLTLPDIVGLHHFFIAYQTPDGNWHSNIDVEIDGQIVEGIEAPRFRTRVIFVFDRVYIRPAPPTALWERISGPWEYRWRGLLQIAVHPNNPEIIYAAVEQLLGEDGRLYKSINGGDSWKPINEGLPCLSSEYYWSVNAIAIAPSNPDIIYVASNRGKRGKIHRSTNAGLTWIEVNYYPLTLFPSISSLLVHPTNPKIVYAGTFGMGIWRTIDGGKSWEQIWDMRGIGEIFYNVNALAVSPANPDIIYAAVHSWVPPLPKVITVAMNQLIKSDDGGDTWQTIKELLDPIMVDDIAVSNEDVNIVYITSVRTVSKSEDGGKTWDAAAIPLGWLAFPLEIIMHPDHSDVIYVGRRSGVYFSPNSGANWFQTELRQWINQLVFVSNASRILYAAGVGDLYKIDLSEGQMVTRLLSPGELRVYDSQGRVTGLVDGVVRQEIPHSVYDAENKIVTIVPPIDTYRFVVAGVEDGRYGLTIISVEDGNVANFTATGIPVSANATYQYTIDWDALARGEEGVTVQIDSDGDGVFERTIKAGDTLTGGDVGVVPAKQVINHGPNPVPPEGCIFWLNLPDDAVEATLKIFDIDGALLVSILLDPFADRYPEIGRFIPRDARGRLLGTGLYLYLVEIVHADGTVSHSPVQKMVIQR